MLALKGQAFFDVLQVFLHQVHGKFFVAGGKGDLAGVFVYKFKANAQLMLLAY